eukprot:1161449-Pelagomonas_calceolata.AAC.1
MNFKGLVPWRWVKATDDIIECKSVRVKFGFIEVQGSPIGKTLTQMHLLKVQNLMMMMMMRRRRRRRRR